MQERRESRNRKDAREGGESRKGRGGGRVRGKIRPSSSEWETIPGREFLSLHTLKGGGDGSSAAL
jgi:hypothetical protein